MSAESLLGCFMPLPQCLLVSSFLFAQARHLCLIVCALGYLSSLANCLCYFKSLHIIVCLGEHVPCSNKALPCFIVSLVSAVLCSSWPVSIPVQFFAGLLGLDHCIWLYTWLTEFELQPSGCEAAIDLLSRLSGP